MATAIGNPQESTPAVGGNKCDLVIHISGAGGPSGESRIKQICSEVAEIFPHLRCLVAYPHGPQADLNDPAVATVGLCRGVFYSADQVSIGIPQLRSRQEYRTAFALAQSAEAKACVLLANDGDLLKSGSIMALVNPVLEEDVDMAVPAYRTGPFEGLVNSAVLYPLARVIYGGSLRYPLAPDLVVSTGAQTYLLQQLLHNPADRAQPGIFWPTLELEIARFKIGQVAVGPRTQSAASSLPLGDLITEVVGSLFTDIQAKASSWQKTMVRGQVKVLSEGVSIEPDSATLDPLPMVESFKLGSSNLQEIWRLVLPPHSLLALKRLAQLPAHEFQMPDSLWVRIVYDFLLAHRSRTISRKHLLGALTPLYLGWVASYVVDIKRSGQEKADPRLETLATAFELDRPYLVSQWRWPDRFNP